MTPAQKPHRTPALARPDWSAPDAGRRYAQERWDNGRRERDPRRVRALLRKYLGAPTEADGPPVLVLDAPCGSGRLAPALSEFAGRPAVALDASLEMLRGHAADGPRLQARVEALPFCDGGFDAVVACRLLHHLSDDELLDAALSELLRVTKRLLIASFWSSRSWPALRRRTGIGRPDRAGRGYRAPAELAARVACCGGRVVELRHSPAWLSGQAFLVARPADPARIPPLRP